MDPAQGIQSCTGGFALTSSLVGRHTLQEPVANISTCKTNTAHYNALPCCQMTSDHTDKAVSCNLLAANLVVARL